MVKCRPGQLTFAKQLLLAYIVENKISNTKDPRPPKSDSWFLYGSEAARLLRRSELQAYGLFDQDDCLRTFG
jgi:hypothetical protein